MDEKFTFFWGEAPFSQWSPSVFEISGIEYTHAEQYMMAEKARLFGDIKTLQKIMKADHPADQKALGRDVSHYNEGVWVAARKSVVYRGNLAKFQQNPTMREKLFATQGTTLVEASPKDRIWGIGLDRKDPRAQKRETWLGQNLLGQVLTELRDNLLQQREDGLRKKKE